MFNSYISVTLLTKPAQPLNSCSSFDKIFSVLFFLTNTSNDKSSEPMNFYTFLL